MPTIQWPNLPPDLLGHLFDRAKERKISMEDLFALEEWRKHSLEVPAWRPDAWRTEQVKVPVQVIQSGLKKTSQATSGPRKHNNKGRET